MTRATNVRAHRRVSPKGRPHGVRQHQRTTRGHAPGKPVKRKPLEWGFDLTDFPNANAFQALLKRHKLTLNVEYPYRKGGKHYPPPGDPTPAERKEWEQKKTFVWSNKEVVMTTANNPLTGEHGMTPSRQREVGYASYIGITGNSSNVRALTQDIKRTASEIKDESPRRRDFI